MFTHSSKTDSNKTKAESANKEKPRGDLDVPSYFVSPQNVMQLQNTIGNSAVVQLMKSQYPQQTTGLPIQRIESGSYTSSNSLADRFRIPNKFHASVQKKSDSKMEQHENNTGMPDVLKAGVENLSGLSMDDVHVHYNSDKPAQVDALAYTKGTDIHVASGQEQYLPHEAWHVAQQKQGRVQARIQAARLPVNDEPVLEKEADEMGRKALIETVTNMGDANMKGNTDSFNGNTNAFKMTDPPIQAGGRKKEGKRGGKKELEEAYEAFKEFEEGEEDAAKELAEDEALAEEEEALEEALALALPLVPESESVVPPRVREKHYMLVKNGLAYQMPVKHYYSPYNKKPYGSRGLLPEPFGGNADKKTPLEALRTEYKQEAHSDLVDPTIIRSKPFEEPWGKGTYSLVQSSNALNTRFFGKKEEDKPPAEKEMVGTLAIDCSGIETTQKGQTIKAVKEKIGTAYSTFLGDNLEDIVKNKDAPESMKEKKENMVRNIFGPESEILQGLVNLIAEDIFYPPLSSSSSQKHKKPQKV